MSRYNIKFKQEDVGYVKPWRITDFIEKITILHYKEELLKEIRLRLNKGVKPENIVLFDKSFNIHRSYSNLSESSLLTQKGAKQTYHLGNILSLYPNKEINSISLLFELFSSTYTIMNKSGVKPFKDRLHVYVSEVLLSNEKELNLISFQNDLGSLITPLSKNDRLDEIREKVNNKIKELNGKHALFCNDKAELEQLETLLSKQPLLEKFKTKKFKELYSKLIRRFYNKFNDIQRPIIGVFHNETKSIEFLATSFIKKEGNDESQIDLKSVTHNSPYEIFISAGATVVMMLYQMYCNKIDINAPLQLMENAEDADETDILEEYMEFDEDAVEIYDEEQWLENLSKLEKFIADKDAQAQEIEVKIDEDVEPNEGVDFILVEIEMKVDSSLRKNFEENNFISGDIDIEKAI